MPVALFLSPHLDDVVFSCGGLAANLADSGWHTVLATVFTRSVVPAAGFARACQLDKGLSADVDYMAIRRAEDEAAAAILSFADWHWLDELEAPHRGYENPPALFGAVHCGDVVASRLMARFAALAAELRPDLVLAPQGLGNHVDHQQVIIAANRSFPESTLAYYRDTPYAIRQPNAAPFASVTLGTPSIVPIDTVLDRKIRAAQAYGSQIRFQFGGAGPLAHALRSFALHEGEGRPGERFCGCPVPGLARQAA